MPKLSCRCGYVHNLSPIPDDGFKVFPDWATDKLLYTLETKPEEWEISALRQTALSRLYDCPNCEAIMWDRAGDGHYYTYVHSERLIRIYADLSDRDRLGRVWLRDARTLAEIEAQRLLPRAGTYFIVHDDRDEIYASLELAVDEGVDPVPESWVARPLGPEELDELGEGFGD